ncbi:calcium-binding protein, partial [Rhizobium leguminosarum]|uniref:calcium-binding protein n=1 Tax=Rhizobium leguminosarum TaxID=384 RepID=UPI003F9A7323
MTDFIVDAANFYTLAQMNGTSGLQLLQALIDAGHKIVITDAVEAEITFSETAGYKDAEIAADWITAHQSEIEVVPTKTFTDLFPNGSNGSPLPKNLGEESILWLANSSRYAENPAIIVSDDSSFFGPDIFNPTKPIQDGVVRHTTDFLLKYALDIDLIDPTDYAILRDELFATGRIEIKHSYTNSDLSVLTSVDPIDGSLVYKNIAGDEVHLSFVATDPFVKLEKVFVIYAGALSEAHDGINGSLVGDKSIVSLLARFMADNSGGVDPAVFAEAAQHLFDQLKEGFSHPNFEASFKAGLVAQFGSAIGDAAELLNAAYEPFIHGFQTGDWSKLGETVFEFGLSSAIGSFVVGAAAVGVGITLGTTAAEIFAIGVVAVGISDGINAALSLASKIFDDLTEAIQPQEQPSQQLLDDLLIRRLLGHLYDQDNPNFQLKDALRQLVTLASAEGPDFRLTGPSGPYDAEHATLVIGTANSDKITSTDDNDVIFSGAGDDVVTARGGKDIVLGGAGSDIFIDSVTEGTEDGRSNEDDIYVGSEAFGDISQNFHNWLSGGGETDIVRYTVDSLVADDPETPEDEGRLQQEGVRVTDLSLSNIHTIQTVAITVEDRAKGNAATDQLIGIEKVELSDRPDELIVKDHSLDVAILIDMGKSGRIESELPVGEALTSDAFTIKVDVVDYSGLSHGINYLNGVTSDHDDVDTLDNIFQWQGYDQELLTIVDYAAEGALGYNNALHVQGADQIKLSDHDDVLISADFGSVITTGEGQDKVWFTNGIGVTDLSADDRIALGGVLTLYGGLKNEASEDPYAWGPYGTSYGLNAEGELVIRNAFWHVTNPDGTPSDEVATMYVLNWKDRTTQGPGGEGEVGPGGIFLAEYHMSFVRFRDITQDMKGQYSVLGEGAFDILGLMIKTMTGHYPWGGQDPLVLDLDGDGIELTALDRSKSKLDLDNDLYSESSGFVGKDDGVLVRDLNGDGKITGSNEMFGNATTSGLAALALLDGNHDGKVDATDSGLADFNGDGAVNTADTFSSLLVWQDANENHITDAGELKSVAERGIASINVTPNTGTTTQTVNGNTIASTAGYTLADGTVRTIADVVLKLDNQNTTYVGTPIQVSQSVLDLADLKGRGTLVSLHEAMSVLPAAETAVRAAVQTLTSPVLSALREAIRPILTAWAEGSPVKIGANIITGTAGLTAYDDLAIVRKDGNVVDYAWGISSSGDDTSDIPGIRMASGVIVSSSEGASGRGELSGLLSQWTGGGSSIVVTTGTELHNGVSVSYLDYRNGDDYLRIYNYQKADWSSGLASSATHTLGSGIAVDTVAGTDFSFYERLIGESLQAFFDVPDSATAGYQAVAAFLDKMDDALNLFAVRLAVQSGPLAHYFESIDYSAQSDGFTSKSGSQIAAVFTALLADAEQSSNAVSWLTEWKPFFDVFLSDYSRGSASQKNTYAFLAQNMLNAVEQNAGGISVVDFAHAFGMAQDLFFTGTGEVNGSGADDILIIDGGETIVRGGTGADSYIIGKTFQSTEIFDDDGIGGSVDTIRFSAHNADNIIASRDGIDLLLTDPVRGAVIRVSNQFEGRWPSLMTGDLSHDYGINQIVFKDGSVWTKVEIAEAVSKIDDASTHIVGTEDIDILQGGKGDDLLEGAGDTDIYRYGRGDGKDTINDYEGNAFRNDQDMLQFLDGIRSGDLIFQRDGASNDLVIHFKDRPLDQITIQGQFAATYTGPYGTWYMNRIDLFTFDDGSSLTSDQVASIVLQANSTDGNDQLYGMEREDILRAGKGDDFISGGNQSDLYLYALGDGHDVIQDRMTNILSGTDDFLRFGAGIDREDISFGRVDGDRHSIVIYVNGGEGSITLQNEFAYAASGVFGDIFFDRIERIDFTSGDQSIAWNEIATTVIAAQKTEGMDVIEGFNLDDVLDGGAGDDTLYGYDGNDTYVWGRGYGNDKIEERGFGALSGGDFDTVIFHDNVTADNVVVSRTMGTNDIILTLKDTGETLTLIEQVSYNAIGYRPQQVDIIRFSNGSEWWAGDIQAHYLQDAKTAGDDHIYGFWTSNTLDGGAGNDVLEGGDGSDTYLFGYGYGHDEIRETYGIVTYSDDDAVRFASGVDVDDVTFQKSGEYGLLISLAGSDDTLLISDEFYVGVWDMNDVERFLFADGTQISREQISQRMIEDQSTSGDDTINGFELDDTINGGDGNDIINAGKGADSITGGRGNDVIDGGGWSDSYYYSRGDGNDTIVDGDWSGGSDRLFFKDVNSSEVSLVRNGNSLLIVIAESAPGVGDGGSVLLKDTIDGFYERGIETISFADGISWSRDVFVPMVINQQGTPGNDTITGSNIADTLAGGKGDDTISGGGGYDTYVYARGDGNDTMFDGDWSGNGDRLLFVDLNPGNISLLRQGNSLKILIAESAPGAGDGGSILFQDTVDGFYEKGFETIQFANGTIWTNDQVRQMLVDQATTAGDDMITGTGRGDIVRGGAGDDTLNGGGGSDAYVYAHGDGNDTVFDGDWSGSGDQIRFVDINPNEVTLVRQGNDLKILIRESVAGAGDDGSILFQGTVDGFYEKGFETIQFANGMIWTNDQVRQMLMDQAATAGNDTINGTGRADILHGDAGDDTLIGGGGGDLYVWGHGNGNDTIVEGDWAGTGDRLQLSGINPQDVTYLRNGNDIVIVIPESAPGAGDGGSISLPYFLDGYYERGVESVLFADGTIYTRTEILPLLPIIPATAGNDSIDGSNGADTFEGGRGNDLLNGLGGNDTYRYSRGDGADTVIEGSAGGTDDRLVFTNINSTEVSLTRSGTDLTITIPKTPTANDAGSVLLRAALDGDQGGVETVVFADGVEWTKNDIRVKLLGAASTIGNDTITGFSSGDDITGGLGNDTINGAGGNDVYHYTRGDGNDVITEGTGSGAADTLLFSGIVAGDVNWSRSGTDLVLTIAPSVAGGTDSSTITLKGALDANAEQGIERFVFADGLVWTFVDFASKIVNVAGTTAAETVNGTNGSDIIRANAGNDVVNGGSGSDVYLYLRGDGSDTINEYQSGGENDRLVFSNINAADVTLVRNGLDLKLVIGESAAGANDAGSVLLTTELDEYYARGIDTVVFADGTVWTRADLRVKVLEQSATDGN